MRRRVSLECLLEKVVALTGVKGAQLSLRLYIVGRGFLRFMLMIRRGYAECILLVACDGVTFRFFPVFLRLWHWIRSPAKPFRRKQSWLECR